MVSHEKNHSIAVIMGSDSDLPTMQSCIDLLISFGLDPVVRVISAHRTPQAALEFAQTAQDKGIKVIIAAAGMAAHLAGAMASSFILPVIGVPMQASTGPDGMDALLSTVQMPPGIPVATVAIGKAGAKNAAVLALQILAVGDDNARKILSAFRDKQTQAVEEKDAQIRAKFQ